MQLLKFSNNDSMPMIGLGTWKSKPAQVYNAIRQALASGYRHIDCAAIYGNEKEVGQALKQVYREGTVSREEVWVTSKLWNNAHKKEDVANALKQTLNNLGLDYLDLYLIHWPVVFRPGVIYPKKANDFISLSKVPILETWESMAACVKSGLIRHIGVSNFSIKKLDALICESGIKPEVNQIELHPFLQQNKMIAYCKSNQIVLTAYSPLGSSDRPAAWKSQNEPSLIENPIILEIAAKHNCTPAQVLIKWAVVRGTAVIPKSVTPTHLIENLAAMDIFLSEQDMEAIATLDAHSRYIPGDSWKIPGSPYADGNLWDE
ncbi:aldo/keto reductase [Desulfobacter sp.]|uniref:aldo/keto reductase n=1 Tax=Desulfobacter sp. TaxID=2294 RepID=UPI000E8B99BF|nr:aldo/keto reductase [Desulfobacter sp.]HBT87856.1 aldehyde oxidoreductase [Desulfobacter sp.]